MEFSSVTVSYLVHATEDAVRLEGKIEEVLGIRKEEFQFDRTEGHYGNEVIFAKAHLIGSRAKEVSGVILSKIDTASRKALSGRLELSVDEHDALYLRLDRQSLGDKLKVSDEEPIRIKMKPKFRFGGRDKMIEEYRATLR